MKPVMQDTFGRDDGNCFSACLASIFEVPLSEVPNFFLTAGDEANAWWAAVRDWLRPRGFGVIGLQLGDEVGLLDEFEGWLIVTGESARDIHHATIWRDGKMVHDPHPSQCGIRHPQWINVLYPLDPSALQVR
ncbi:MAG TPA: hypothetical protein VF555_16580 [Variovorax sp.]